MAKDNDVQLLPVYLPVTEAERIMLDLYPWSIGTTVMELVHFALQQQDVLDQTVNTTKGAWRG